MFTGCLTDIDKVNIHFLILKRRKVKSIYRLKIIPNIKLNKTISKKGENISIIISNVL